MKGGMPAKEQHQPLSHDQATSDITPVSESQSSSPANALHDLETHDSALKALEKARSIANITERSIRCAEIMKALCKAGRVDEAIALLYPEPGQVRNYEISAIFSNCQLNYTDALLRIQTLGADDDASTAIGAYLRDNVEIAKLNEFLGNEDFKRLADRIAKQFPGYLSNEIAGFLELNIKRQLLNDETNPNSYRNILDVATTYRKTGVLDDAGLMQVLSACSNTSTFDKWEMIENLVGPAPANSDTDVERKRIIKEMITEDAAKTVETILKSNSQDLTEDTAHLVKEWGNVDSNALTKWYESQKDKLTPSQKDDFSYGFAMVADSFNEKEQAIRWVNMIANDQLRKKVIDKLRLDNTAQ